MKKHILFYIICLFLFNSRSSYIIFFQDVEESHSEQSESSDKGSDVKEEDTLSNKLSSKNSSRAQSAAAKNIIQTALDEGTLEEWQKKAQEMVRT